MKRTLMYRYRSHLAYVKSKVPSDDLLLQNVKDGWEPICNFLNVPFPNEPFTTMNMTGDKNKNHDFIQKNFMGTKGVRSGLPLRLKGVQDF